MTNFNVIFIVLDGLRRDRVYLCPHLSDILRTGYFFSNMVTAAPYTLSSFYSIITGLYPPKHGVNSYFNMFKFKKSVCKTIMQYLHDNGFYTEANLVNDSILPKEGFDTFSAHDEYRDDLIKLHKDIITRASGKKFFLFLHYDNLHTHGIVNVAKKYNDFDKEYFNNYERNERNYNSWLVKLDEYVNEVYEHIKKIGLLDNTIIVFLSDHGTSNGEKTGERMYGSFTYDYTLRVFSSILVPNTKPREIKPQTRTIDIMPTILDILKINVDESYEHLDGKSLVSFIEGKENEDRIAFAETGGLNGPWPSHHEHNVFCIRTRKWKLIYNKTPDTWEMYDLENDPEEKNNLFDKKNHMALKLQKLILDHITSGEGKIIY